MGTPSELDRFSRVRGVANAHDLPDYERLRSPPRGWTDRPLARDGSRTAPSGEIGEEDARARADAPRPSMGRRRPANEPRGEHKPR